jgi:hypothetical protein
MVQPEKQEYVFVVVVVVAVFVFDLPIGAQKMVPRALLKTSYEPPSQSTSSSPGPQSQIGQSLNARQVSLADCTPPKMFSQRF